MIDTIAVKNLTVSRANVRKTGRNADNDALKASIAAHGLLQNLVGIPQKKKGHVSIIAGGRRLACLQDLMAEGVLAEDHAVPVQMLDETTEPSEASLAENFQRQAMNPADEAQAFAVLADKGMSPADIAKRFGLTERHVKQRLRLAALAMPVLDALREFELTVDQALAFTVSTDADLQAKVYKVLCLQAWNMTVRTIRARMLETSIASDDRLCRFIGRDAYLAAGGRTVEDLFAANETTETWLDRKIVEELAEAKLLAETQALAARDGVAWVKPLMSPTVGWQETQEFHEVRGTPVVRSAEDEARIAELEAALEQIDDADTMENDSERYDALFAELETLQQPVYNLSDDDKAAAGVFAVIDANGTVRIDRRYYSETAPRQAGNASTGRKTDAAASGLSETLAGDLARQRSQILQTHVAQDPALAFDLAAFIAAEKMLKRYCQDLGSQLRMRDCNPTIGAEPDSLAALLMAQLQAGLDTSWRDGSTAGARFDAFRALAEDARAAWFAFAIATSLEPSLNVATGNRAIAFHDHIARSMDLDPAQHWRPTVKNYFGRVPKPRLLDILTEIGGPPLASRYGAAKKGDIAKALEALCAGQTIIEADIKQKALDWMPAEMQFAAIEQATGARTSSEIDDDADDDQPGDDQTGDDDAPTCAEDLQETDAELADAA
jgi:ParB family transcriptional regulator, chromosome partitioning protein